MEYALKSGISLTVFYLFYWLVLHNDTHFSMNRFVLLFAVIVSIVLPAFASDMVKVPQALQDLPVMSIEFDTRDNVPLNDQAATGMAATATRVNYLKVIFIVYLLGAVIIFGRLIYQAIFLHAVARLSEKSTKHGFTIVSMNNDMVPFSYFNRIFIPKARIDEGSFDSIISHEKSHMSQGHFIDLFIIEVMSVFQWFNPVIWFYEKSIKELHEYLADEAVLNTGKSPGRYQALMVNQALGGPVFILSNQFNQSLIKKRITMMKKARSSRVTQLKVLLIVPLVTVLLLAFASPQMNSQSAQTSDQITVSGKVTDRSAGTALPGTVVIIKGTTIGTISDNEGNYEIIVDGSNKVLFFSQVGYRTQEVPVAGNTTINIQLEQDILALDFSGGNKLNSDVKPETGNKTGEGLYVVTEELVTYPGGTDALRQFLMANLQYPEADKKKGIQGTVMVTYVINADGSVTKAKVMRGVSPEIDREALRLTNMIKGWKSASQNGHPKSVVVTMPIEFKLK